MKQKIDRREMLKLLAAASCAPMAQPIITPPLVSTHNPGAPNLLLLVFDAFSGLHLPFLGYPRPNMPFTSELAKGATVFQHHYAGGPFTTSGTSTLLTGTYPWTNRAFLSNSQVLPKLRRRNIFHLFAEQGYHQIAYSHNAYVVTLLRQFRDAIDSYIPRQDLFLGEDLLFSRLLINDWDISIVANDRALDFSDKVTNSVLMSRLLTPLQNKQSKAVLEQYADTYPRGLPRIRYNNFYLLEDAIDFIHNSLPSLPQPFMGYFHLLPPHGPYATRQEFIDIFKEDGYTPIEKPTHAAFTMRYKQGELNELRREYDEYIALVDAEFARLYKGLESSGLLDNTYLVLTSDHGEMFERGIARHMTQALFNPVIQIPLIVFEPGQSAGRQVADRTSAVDILPTLLTLAGAPVPEWAEGQILPPYRQGEPDGERNIHALMAHRNPGGMRSRLRVASSMLIKDDYKLTYYFGYPELDGSELCELYHLGQDPQEMQDLYSPTNPSAQELLQELKQTLYQADQPYH